jgi:hypothetical protein
MEVLKHSILKVLTYFDIFSYPLLQNEIHYYLDQQTSPEALPPALGQLTDAEIIYCIEGYYSLRNDAGLVHKRIEDNTRAEALLPKARMVCNFLSYFPFVRAIGISGSLSKNVAYPGADFDYFIITKANRLWIARTILALLSRCSAIVGKQEWLCLNYFIDESCLQIPEQNIYTATEIFTLILTRQNPTSQLFLEANNWVNQFYPNYRHKRSALQACASPNLVKKAVETRLGLALINTVDNWLMNWTISRLKKKKESGELVLKGKELQLPLSDKHYCKHNPAYFQEEVLNAYAKKMDILIKRYRLPGPVTKASFAEQ